jgi:leucyl-tRNA synthetase
LSAAREYVKQTSSAITSAEAAQQKKKDKGKATAYDPKKPKVITIYVATSWPAWQEKYVALVKEQIETKAFDDKELNTRVAKLGEMKKAMPFVQALKRRITSGEDPKTVFNRGLEFDEVETVSQMAPGLKRTTGCKDIHIVVVGEDRKKGQLYVDGKAEKEVEAKSGAEGAVPGSPGFFFENVEV